MLVFAVGFAFLSVAFADITCLDGNGLPVDSWVALKHNNARNYSVYVDSQASFQRDSYFGALHSPFDATLLSLYAEQGAAEAYALYNDQTPSMHQGQRNAHMKGILAIGGDTGFWLIHSIPRFPVTMAEYNATGYAYPDNETKYGQSLMCLTLDRATFETVAKAMYIDYPQVYDSSISSELATELPTLAQVLAGQHDTGNTAKTLQIETTGGVPVTIFAKTRGWGKELYEDFVAPTIGDGLLVESWLNGRGKLGSTCSPYTVYDVEKVMMPDNIGWKETQDHSKWAVGLKTPWTCVGDINRQHGQLSRGGGTYCRHDMHLWTAFRSVITAYNTTCAQK